MKETSRSEYKKIHANNKLYMNEADFDSVMIIAGERPDIRTVMSSTPTGKRSKFYMACTNPDMGLNINMIYL